VDMSMILVITGLARDTCSPVKHSLTAIGR
jgi:hypothetical protein